MNIGQDMIVNIGQDMIVNLGQDMIVNLGQGIIYTLNISNFKFRFQQHGFKPIFRSEVQKAIEHEI